MTLLSGIETREIDVMDPQLRGLSEQSYTAGQVVTTGVRLEGWLALGYTCRNCMLTYSQLLAGAV